MDENWGSPHFRTPPYVRIVGIIPVRVSMAETPQIWHVYIFRKKLLFQTQFQLGSMFFLRRLQSVTIQNYSGYLVVIKTRNGKELLSICISPFPGKYKIFALLSASLCWRFFWGVIMTGFIGITAPMWRSPGFSSWQDLSLTEAQVTWSTRDGDRHGRDPRDFFSSLPGCPTTEAWP